MRKELVYVPQRTVLANNPDYAIASHTKEITSPGVYLVIRENEDKYGIFCDGSIWYVNSKECFKVE